MRIFHSSLKAKDKIKRPVIALGNFDGVHLAHQKMFALTCELARSLNGTPCVYTFEPHPVRLLFPALAPPLLSTLGQKEELIRAQKIEALILEPFTQTFASLSPEDFLKKILIDRLHVAGLVVGYDFTFGAHRAGNTEVLQALCEPRGIVLKILKAFRYQGSVVSSSQIRKLIGGGEICRANQMLGHCFELRGRVIHGQKRGTKLGFPTANLKTENELIPAPGVYVTRTKLNKKVYAGVTSIGYRPTFGANQRYEPQPQGKLWTLNAVASHGESNPSEHREREGEAPEALPMEGATRAPVIETHLFSFHKNIYRRKLGLEFIRRIRSEKKFSSVESLKRQIEKDVQSAQKNQKARHHRGSC